MYAGKVSIIWNSIYLVKLSDFQSTQSKNSADQTLLNCQHLSLFDIFQDTSLSTEPFICSFEKQLKLKRKNFNLNPILSIAIFCICIQSVCVSITAGSYIFYKGYMGGVMYHILITATAAATPPETASGRSIAMTQVINEWEILMLYHIIHLCITLLCNLGLTMSMSTINPDELWKAFIPDRAEWPNWT